MKIFITVDNNNGMLFNKRRQSQDIELRNYILKETNSKLLYLNEYTFKQFKDMENIKHIIIDENFLENTSTNYCFVENLQLQSHLNKIDTIYLCKWNCDYPSDFKLDINIEEHFKLVSTIDIVGQAHEKITIEEWRKQWEKQ